MIRDYTQGTYESLDISIENAGSDKNGLKADGIFKSAFSDLVLYEDSGYTIPISASAYESTTTDSFYTTSEIGYSDKTIYTEYRVLDPTYQTGTIYARFNNFAVYTNGEAVGMDLTVIDSGTAYTTSDIAFLTYFELDGLTADTTMTISNGSGDQRNVFKVANIDSTYKGIVTDGVETFWVMPNESISFFYRDGTLTREKGWGLVYTGGTTNTVAKASVLGGVNAFDKFELQVTSGGASRYSGTLITTEPATANIYTPTFSYTSDNRLRWLYSDQEFSAENGAYLIQNIWKYYKG